MKLQHFSARLAAKSADYRSGGSIMIVAFGDSVTMGYTAGGKLIPGDVYHHRLKCMLEQHYPQAVFSVINSGIGGNSIDDGDKRLDRDVLRYQPDLVTIGFGLNDAAANQEGAELFQQKLSAMVTRIRQNTPADVILLTPNYMNTRAETLCVDPTLQDRFQDLSARFSAIQNGGYLGRFAEAIRNVGRQYQVPVADVYHEWDLLARSGTDIMAMLANRLNHPVPSAHQIAADALFRIITTP